MSASQRRKGRAAQTQGRQILEDAGWGCIDTGSGVALEDVFAIAPDGTRFSVEITADQGISLTAKWGQARRQADARGGTQPMLLWRFDGHGWWAIVNIDAHAHRLEADPWLLPAQHHHPRTLAKRWHDLGCIDPDVVPRFALDGGELTMAPAHVVEDWWR